MAPFASPFRTSEKAKDQAERVSLVLEAGDAGGAYGVAVDDAPLLDDEPLADGGASDGLSCDGVMSVLDWVGAELEGVELVAGADVMGGLTAPVAAGAAGAAGVLGMAEVVAEVSAAEPVGAPAAMVFAPADQSLLARVFGEAFM